LPLPLSPSGLEDVKKIEVGSAVNVVHFNTVADFYIHVKDQNREKAFCDLMLRLKDECVNCSVTSYLPKESGEVVAALRKKVWHRAAVLGIISTAACRIK